MWAGLVVSLAGGCAKPTTYGYQYKLAQQFGGGEDPEAANHEARALLAGARTVAFYPPDLCLNTDTAGTGHNQKVVQANCGVLLSTLERAAERAGYEVLSWQNLRGQKRPIEYAREANVDVLFEINEFDLESVNDSEAQRTLTFYKVDAAGATSALQVPQTVAQRCAAYSAQRDPLAAAGLTGTIDIKTVAVNDGRDRWHYRKTLSQSVGRSYPEVGFTALPKPNPAVGVLGGLGLASVIVGGTLILLTAVTTDDPTTGTMKPDFGSVPTYLIVGGLLAAGAAIAVGVATQATAAPNEVLCLDTAQVGPTLTPAPPPPPSGPMTSEVTFSQSTGADPLVKQRAQIRDAMIADFITVLSDVHANVRAQPPAVPPPAPPPAAPAPPPGR